ncbi:MAG: RNA polymerase factor sigma-54 [Ahrensia sp.]|nr:RNA polymerase factor sigma-54 [Ahrensia sp.]
MALAQKLALRQSQSLVMTQQLSQSIKLLTLSNIELNAFIDSQLEANPFLEVDHSVGETRAPDAEHASLEARAENAELKLDSSLETDAKRLSETLGTDVENAFPDDPSLRGNTQFEPRRDEQFRISSSGLPTSTSRGADDVDLGELTPQRLTLRDHLHSQLAIAAAPPRLHALAACLVDLLDDAGYLREDFNELSERLSVEPQEIDEALKLVQTFEPTGIGARSLSECLALQLREKNRLDPAMQLVLDNLHRLAKRDFVGLGLLTGLDVEELSEILQEVQALEPRPGSLFASENIADISPDVVVSEAPDGSWRVELNSETLPRVLVDQNYVAEVSKQADKGKDREFVTECLQNASWLTRSLDQRAHTILKVAREIVKKQDAFLVHGVRGLKPLTLQMIADEIDMHESSVSRVTSGKYMLTPRGMFELKYFFTTAITSTGDGDAHSSEAVRDRIKSMIDSETAATVLSDDAVVSALEAAGIKIARRTVAKYRDAMMIPSSVQRRREKQAEERARLREPA